MSTKIPLTKNTQTSVVVKQNNTSYNLPYSKVNDFLFFAYSPTQKKNTLISALNNKTEWGQIVTVTGSLDDFDSVNINGTNSDLSAITEFAKNNGCDLYPWVVMCVYNTGGTNSRPNTYFRRDCETREDPRHIVGRRSVYCPVIKQYNFLKNYKNPTTWSEVVAGYKWASHFIFRHHDYNFYRKTNKPAGKPPVAVSYWPALVLKRNDRIRHILLLAHSSKQWQTATTTRFNSWIKPIYIPFVYKANIHFSVATGSVGSYEITVASTGKTYRGSVSSLSDLTIKIDPSSANKQISIKITADDMAIDAVVNQQTQLVDKHASKTWTVEITGESVINIDTSDTYYTVNSLDITIISTGADHDRIKFSGVNDVKYLDDNSLSLWHPSLEPRGQITIPKLYSKTNNSLLQAVVDNVLTPYGGFQFASSGAIQISTNDTDVNTAESSGVFKSWHSKLTFKITASGYYYINDGSCPLKYIIYSGTKAIHIRNWYNTNTDAWSTLSNRYANKYAFIRSGTRRFDYAVDMSYNTNSYHIPTISATSSTTTKQVYGSSGALNLWWDEDQQYATINLFDLADNYSLTVYPDGGGPWGLYDWDKTQHYNGFPCWIELRYYSQKQPSTPSGSTSSGWAKGNASANSHDLYTEPSTNKPSVAVGFTIYDVDGTGDKYCRVAAVRFTNSSGTINSINNPTYYNIGHHSSQAII